MRLKDLFEKWGLSGLKVKSPILELEWAPDDPDREAAWDLYVELVTRVATQTLPEGEGQVGAALDSVYSLFPSTRRVLKEHGRKAENFAKVAIVILNEVVRPFTTQWHGRELTSPEDQTDFRNDMAELQRVLRRYARMLAYMAGVEDLIVLQTGGD